MGRMGRWLRHTGVAAVAAMAVTLSGCGKKPKNDPYADAAPQKETFMQKMNPFDRPPGSPPKQASARKKQPARRGTRKPDAAAQANAPHRNGDIGGALLSDERYWRQKSDELSDRIRAHKSRMNQDDRELAILEREREEADRQVDRYATTRRNLDRPLNDYDRDYRYDDAPRSRPNSRAAAPLYDDDMYYDDGPGYANAGRPAADRQIVSQRAVGSARAPSRASSYIMHDTATEDESQYYRPKSSTVSASDWAPGDAEKPL